MYLVSHDLGDNSLSLKYKINFGLDYEYDAPNTLFAHLNSFEFPVDAGEYFSAVKRSKEPPCKQIETTTVIIGFQLGYKRRTSAWILEDNRLINLASFDGVVKGYSFKSEVS
jgi:hypothetical protein